jgi:membrane-bound lytic murein transglycosylase F
MRGDTAQNEEHTDLSLEKIQKKGKLVVLAENSTTSYFIYKGKKLGFEYDILKQFANDLGVKLEVKVIKNLDHSFELLNNGEGDILACNLTLTKERKKQILFSVPFLRTNLVLVQRKPKNWRNMPSKKWRDSILTDPVELAHKKIHVWENSIYFTRLTNLMDEIGDTIYLVPESGDVETELLIEKVADGEIDYTVADQNIAIVNQRFYDNLDINLPLSVKQQIAFGLSKESKALQTALNNWLVDFMKKPIYAYLHHKYFEISTYTSKSRSTFSSLGGKKISPYDAIIKKEANKIGIDWRLVCSIIYQESKFIPDLESWAGAYGLMQFMPGTGERFGVYPDSPPNIQVKGGMQYIQYIYRLWKKIPNENDRIHFLVASYNCGAGHIIDAQRIAEKYGYNPLIWKENVALFVPKMSSAKYYNDNVVKNGSFNGKLVINYVNEVMTRYIEYKTAFPNKGEQH